jgi:ABC-2 type transport system ATP-binding protein
MIEIRQIQKHYGRTKAADGVTFSAPAGKVTALLGPNGAGKTTTMRILLGLTRPDGGEALIGDRTYAELEDPRRIVGAVLDSMGFHPGRSGRNHLRLTATAAGIATERVDEVLGLVGLGGDASRRAGGYSRGMQQRLALAGALLGDPDVLVLDEPTIGLDPAGIAWLREMMRGWASEGRTVLVSSHMLSEVELVADRAVIINQGRVLLETETGNLTGNQHAVTVRTPDTDRLQELCQANGWETRLLNEERLSIQGASTDQVGRAAAEAGIVLFELTAEPETAHLEQIYLKLTTTDAQELS